MWRIQPRPDRFFFRGAVAGALLPCALPPQLSPLKRAWMDFKASPGKLKIIAAQQCPVKHPADLAESHQQNPCF